VAVPERRPLGDDEYWPPDLIGLAVFEPDGRGVGVVIDVVLGPGQDRLRVQQADGVIFEVPFVDALVPVVDLESGRIEIELIPGLIEP
jgi:16S rRNA processing protein RimM